jgi:hypothetical protein
MSKMDDWFAGAVGRGMNPDSVYGYQCVDVPKDYAMKLFDVSWRDTIGFGNAKDLFNAANEKYFDKVANNPNDPNQIPPRGAIVVYGGWPANPYGHINVVESSNTAGFTAIEQDGYYVKYDAQGNVTDPGRVAYRVRRTYAWRPMIGWLIPKLPAEPEPGKGNIVMVDEAGLSVLYRFYLGDVISDYGYKYRLGKQTFAQAQKEILESSRYRDYVRNYAQTQAGAVNNLPSAMRTVTKLPEQVIKQGVTQ